MDLIAVTETREPETVADVLLSCARSHPREPLITYVSGSSKRESVSGAELLVRAQQAAAVLRENGVAAGDRVLLMLLGQADFVEAFFGTIWADAVPVPLVPPAFTIEREEFKDNLNRIIDNSKATDLVADEAIVRTLTRVTRNRAKELRVLPPVAVTGSNARLEESPRRRPNDLAMLQYTSGSTRSPRGVALTHANIIANLRAIGQAIRISRRDIGVSWLPLYHDMGLIGLLATLYRGGTAALLSPRDFAKDPACWLRAIGEFRGTLSPAPNFAFHRCTQLSDDELEGLDLSSWRVAFNGSEPVDPDTVRAFVSRFAPFGFRSSTICPVYGLAEHTLAVSFPPLGDRLHVDRVDRDSLETVGIAVSASEEHENAMSFVSVGVPLSGVEIEVRDENGVALPNRHIGEVTVRSASVMRGYYDDAEATREALNGRWLRTGDLGYLKNGLLYITGRSKDLIIRSGRNYYPHDIESAATSVSGVKGERAAAFSVPGGENLELVVLLAESNAFAKTSNKKLANDIASAVARRVGFQPEFIELLPRGKLPVTSSGKVRRHEARKRYLNGDLHGR